MCFSARQEGLCTLGLALALFTAVGPAHAQSVLYVDDDADTGGDGLTWSTAHRYLQDALAAAEASGGTVTEIRVAQGTYKPDQGANHTPGFVYESFYLVENVGVYGGFAGTETDRDEQDPLANPTILSGDLNDDDAEVADPRDLGAEPTRTDNCAHVVRAISVSSAAILDGFTITAGHADLSYHEEGGGIYTEDSSLTVRGCRFAGNYSRFNGGGAYIKSDSATFVGCVFQANAADNAGAGVYSRGTTTILEDCQLIDNVAGSAAGSLVGGGQAAVTRCVFVGNRATSGGALSVWPQDSQVDACWFMSNSASTHGGGAFIGSGTHLFSNCVFTGNTAVEGGALYTGGDDADPTLLNCSITGNQAVNGAGGMQSDNREATFANCILWGNASVELTGESAQFSGMVPSINYSCIQGWTGDWGGVGNFGDAPALVDADGPDNIAGTADDNLRLRADSPCIDAGDNGALPPDVQTDLDGNPRFADDPATDDTGHGTPPIVDMGAYEGPKQSFLVSVDRVDVPENGTATFTVALAFDPLETVDVAVTHYSGDADISVADGAPFTFDSQNYDEPRTVTLAAADDPDWVYGSALIRISATHIPAYDVTAVEADDDFTPSVLYVDDDAAGADNGTSWDDAFTDLQVALTTAAEPSSGVVSEVHVAAGTYVPSAQTDPEDTRSATFQLLNNLAIRGGYPGVQAPDPNERDFDAHETILSGDLNGDDRPGFSHNEDNAYHVVTTSDTDATAVLDGFTITAGNESGGPDHGGGILNDDGDPTLTSLRIIHNGGTFNAGMYNNSGNPTLFSCVFVGNAGAFRNSGGSPTLIDCTFNENNSGVSNSGGTMTCLGCVFTSNSRAVFNREGTVTLTECTFTDNFSEGFGGALCNDWSAILFLSNCVFTSNSSGSAGGAIYHGRYCSIMLDNCLFADNSAAKGGALYNHGENQNPFCVNCCFIGNHATLSGGAVYDYSSLSGPSAHATLSSLVNCALSGNSATTGGAIYTSGGDTTAVNCTFAGNSALETGGAIHHNGGHIGERAILHVVNSVFWGNLAAGTGGEDAQIHVADASIDMNYSLIEGLTGVFGGTGNIGNDPLFVGADGPDEIVGTLDDNLRLADGSPCLNAGDNTALPADLTDLDDDGDTDEPIPLDLDLTPRVPDDDTVDMGAYEDARLELVFGSTPVTVPEGGSASFTVALADDPLGLVTISVAHYAGDSDITVQSGQTLTFDSGNFLVPQPVTLAATEDDDNRNGTAVIRLDAAGTPLADILTTEADDSPPPILFVDASATGANDGTSWNDAYTKLTDALARAATPGVDVDQIWVAAGTYKPAAPGGDRRATFQLVNGVSLYGGFAGTEDSLAQRDPATNETILSGDLNGDDSPDQRLLDRLDNSYNVVTGSGTDATAVIDGFTITAGNADPGSWCTSGGGMYNDQASPTIVNCVFKLNSAGWGGGLANYDSDPTLTHCRFIGNEVDNSSGDGGAVRNRSSSPTLTDCLFVDNSANKGTAMSNESNSNPRIVNCIFENNGGCYVTIRNSESSPNLRNCSFINNATSAVGNIDCSPTFTDCMFLNNLGPGMCNDSSSPTLVNCSFLGNKVSGSYGFSGAGMNNGDGSSPTLINCLFAGNAATTEGSCRFNGGGAMANWNSNPVATNCTFAANTTDCNGGAIYNNDGNPVISNCIMWGNQDRDGTGESSQIHTFSGTPVVNHCCIQGLTGSLGGSGNIGGDPLFLRYPNDGGDGWGAGDNDDFGDLRLQRDSPCIDAADNTIVPNDDADLDDDGDTTERTPIDLTGAQRFIDNPATTDTGVADPPGYPTVVDMGAYEYDPSGDYDEDGEANIDDNCLLLPNPDQTDTDDDGFGDVCDGCPNDPHNDADGDGFCGDVDNCPNNPNPDQADEDNDDFGDVCDTCPTVPYTDQTDSDGDGLGDACDNCPDVPNADQADANGDGRGDVCDEDDDSDGVPDTDDNCPTIFNSNQSDSDEDGVGDACDSCPDTPAGVPVDEQGCPWVIPGDLDGDFDVDQSDFGHFQVCLSGSGVPQTDPSCQGALLDDDSDVDQTDLAIFQGCMTGANVLGDPACADG